MNFLLPKLGSQQMLYKYPQEGMERRIYITNEAIFSNIIYVAFDSSVTFNIN